MAKQDIYFAITADNSGFIQRVNETQQRLNAFTQNIQAQGQDVDSTFAAMGNSLKRVGMLVGVGFGVTQVKNFVSECINARAQMQSLATSFETLLGSKSKADSLVNEMKQYAASTPMDVSTLAGAAQTMLGFGIQSEKVMPMLKSLGDISMGDAQKFSSLALAFSQASSTGKLMGQDFLQMVNAGFNPLNQMAKDTGKSVAELKEEMSEGKISVKMLEDAFQNATKVGGQFHGMMEAQSKTINGSFAQLRGAVVDMFSDMGEEMEGIVVTGANVATTLAKNWRVVGQVLLDVVATYGVYKAAVMVNAAATAAAETVAAQSVRAAYAEQIAALQALLPAKEEATKSALEQAVANGQLTASEAAVITALKEEAQAHVENLNAQASAAQARAAAAAEALTAAEDELSVAEELKSAAEEQLQTAIEQGNQDAINAAQSDLATAAEAVQTAQTEVNSAAEAVNSATKEANAAATAAKTAQTQLDTISTAENTIAEQTNGKMTAVLTLAKQKLIGVIQKLYAAMKANPWGLALAAVTALITGIYKLITAESAEEAQQRKMGEAKASARTEIVEETRKLDNLFDALKSAKEGTEAYNAAKKEIWGKYGGWLKSLGDENTALNDQAAAYALIHKNIVKVAQAKARASYLEDFEADFNEHYAKNAHRLEAELNSLGLTTSQVSALMSQTMANITAGKSGDAALNIKGVARMMEGTMTLKQANAIRGYVAKMYAEVVKLNNAEKNANDAFGTEKDLEVGSATPGAGDADNKAKDKSKGRAAERYKTEAEIAEQIYSIRAKNAQDLIDLEKDSAEKEIQQIRIDYENRIAEIEKQEREMAKGNKSGKLTAEQDAALKQSRQVAAAQRDQALREVYMEDTENLLEYLRNFGTFAQRKTAVTEEYGAKIEDAKIRGNESERQRLEREQAAELAKIEAEALSSDIDWSAVFGDFGGMFGDIIRPELEKLKDYTRTDAFKAQGAQDQETIYNRIAELQKTLGETSPTSFAKLGKQVENLQKNMGYLNRANELVVTTTAAEIDARKAYQDALTKGSEAEQERAKLALDAAINAREAAETQARIYQTEVDNARNIVTTSATTLKQGMDNIIGGIQGLTGGSIAGGVEGIKKLAEGLQSLEGMPKGIKDAASNIFKALENIPIIGIIAALLDVLKDGITQVFTQLIDTIFSAVTNIIKDVLSGGFAVGVLKSLASGLGSIIDAFTFGGFSSWFGANGNSKEVNLLTENLTDSNDRLRESIDKLKDEMSKKGGVAAISTAAEAKERAEAINRQTMEILEAQMGYHAAHHSNAYYWNLSASDYSALNASLAEYARRNGTTAKQVSSLADLYLLTPEEMDYIRTHNVNEWKKMLEQGKYDKSEYWTQYADLAGAVDEITDALNEALTRVTFDSLRDSFVSSLMDMDKSAADFADDFSEYLMKAVLNARIADIMDADLKKWYEDWAKYSQAEGGLTAANIDELRRRWEDLVQRGLDIRNEAAQLTGYDNSSAYSQEASHGYAENITEDTAEEISGRLTAIQEGVFAQYDLQVAELSGTKTLAVLRNEMLDNIDTNIGSAAIHLQTIAKNTAELFGISEVLAKIERKLKTI